jgi:hypothetical protein
MLASTDRPLGQQFLRSAAIYQTLSAIPAVLFFSKCAWDQWFNRFTYHGFL